MITNLIEKLKLLSNDQLISLSQELRHATVPEDALVRQVIKGTEYDTTAPILAFTAVQASLSIVLADRLISATMYLNVANTMLADYENAGYSYKELKHHLGEKD